MPVVVNMPKARGIHMDRIREVRNQQLLSLDVPYMRSIEVGNSTEQIRLAGLKQKLRDIPQTFDLNTPNDSPYELERMWPAGLLRLGE